MDNASKALLMAGGVLVALIIIAILARTYTNISKIQQTQLTAEEEAELVAFNEQYTKYLNQHVYGTEVISVINKSLDNNSHTLKTIIKFADGGNGYSYNGYAYNEFINRNENSLVTIKKEDVLEIVNDEENNFFIQQFINSLQESGGLNRMAFECTKIGYDSYGRVNSIKFEERKWGDLW